MDKENGTKDSVKREKAIQYLKKRNMTEEKANRVLKMIERHPDLYAEFSNKVCDGIMPYKPVIIEGYSARSLMENFNFSVYGAYCCMVNLRENPKVIKEKLQSGMFM